MNLIGNYKGYPIYRCSRNEYEVLKRRRELEEGSVYCITDENEILLMNDCAVGQARLRENRVIRFEPSRARRELVYREDKSVKMSFEEEKSNEGENSFLPEGVKLEIFDLEKFLKEEVKFDLGVYTLEASV